MQCENFETSGKVRELYEISNIFLNSLFAGEVDKWNLYLVKLHKDDEPYVVKIMSSPDSRGIMFCRGGDSLTSLALMRDAVSAQEIRGLLCERDCFVCRQYKVPGAAPDFLEFADRAGIEAPLRDHLVYFFHPAHRGISLLQGREPAVLLRILELCMSPETASEEEFVTRVKIPEGLALKVIYSVAFGLPESLEEAFAARAGEQNSISVQGKKNLVYEVDFHFASYAQKETGSKREDVAFTVVSRNCDALLYVNLAEDDESLFTAVVRSIWVTLHKHPVPVKIICAKHAVSVWLESVCDVLGIELELVSALESTERRLAKIRSASRKHGSGKENTQQTQARGVENRL